MSLYAPPEACNRQRASVKKGEPKTSLSSLATVSQSSGGKALENKPKVMKKQSRSQRTASRKVSNTCALQQIVLKSPIYRNSDCWRRNFKSLPFKRDQNQDRTPDVSRAAFNLPRVLQ